MVDIDAAGGVATGGLIGAAIEKPAGQAGERHETCTDCGEPVSGKFCSNCGQPTHVHRTLLHLFEEVLHGVLHFDARIWRTLPLLLLNPGRLTREWIQGKRTRYVSPLAIFLFTVFLMFFLMSFGGSAIETAPLEERIADAGETLTEDRTALAEAQAELAAAERALAAAPEAERDVLTGPTTIARNALDNANQNVERSAERLAELEAMRTAGPRADGYEVGSWQAELVDAVREERVTIGVGDKKMQEKILHKLADPEFAFYKIQQTLYKFAFLLVPLSIPFVWLLFAWKRGFTWYDHGVFVLYSLTFMAIFTMGLFLIDWVVDRSPVWLEVVLGSIASLALFAVPVHMFAQLKGTYGLGWFSALWRTFVLLNFCGIILSMFVLVVIVLGLVG